MKKHIIENGWVTQCDDNVHWFTFNHYKAHAISELMRYYPNATWRRMKNIGYSCIRAQRKTEIMSIQNNHYQK